MPKKLVRLLLILSCITCTIINAQNQPIVYQLKSYYATSLTMRIEVFTQHLNRFVLDKSRSWIGDDKPIKNVFCADDGRLIIYGKKEKCSLIFWEVNFYREPMAGLGSRSTGDYYFNNNQWLLRESNNFPRFKKYPQASVCINNNNCVPLPMNNKLSGALFLLWGKDPTVVDAAGLTFEIFTDKQAENIDIKALMLKMEPSIRYLNTVFIPKLGNRIEKPIKIIMLAKDSQILKDSGGQAGNHAFLVNYYVENGQLIDNWQESFLEIALHEYMHILTACDTFSRWSCESLADYYASKAQTLGQVNLNALENWNNRHKTNPNDQLGLYKIDQKYQQTKRWDYYKLFYAKGAAFWNELDLLLHQKNHNLDEYIDLLTIDASRYQTKLPKVFISKMIEVLGKKEFVRLSKKYLN